VVALASLTDPLLVFFGEWVFRSLFFARRFPVFAIQLCFQELVFVSNVQRREHGQFGAIGCVGFGNGAHHRIDGFSERPNVARVAAAQAVRLIENLDLHAAQVTRSLSQVVHSRPPSRQRVLAANYSSRLFGPR